MEWFALQTVNEPLQGQAGSATQNEVDANDPGLTLPLPRYNAMLGVLRNTLYM